MKNQFLSSSSLILFLTVLLIAMNLFRLARNEAILVKAEHQAEQERSKHEHGSGEKYYRLYV